MGLPPRRVSTGTAFPQPARLRRELGATSPNAPRGCDPQDFALAMSKAPDRQSGGRLPLNVRLTGVIQDEIGEIARRVIP